MNKVEIDPEETDFALKGGKIRVRITWAYRILVAVLMIAYYFQTFWLARNFASKEDVKENKTSVDELKISIMTLQKDITFMNLNTIDNDQSRRLDDHETRIRLLEQKVK